MPTHEIQLTDAERDIAEAYGIEPTTTYYTGELRRFLNKAHLDSVYRLIHAGHIKAVHDGLSWQIKGKWIIEYLCERSNLVNPGPASK